MNQDPALAEFVTYGREERNLEYKGTQGREPFIWKDYPVKAKTARTAMAMANIGGGVIVIGMDEVASDRWEANGVTPEADQTYQQDEVQQFVNQYANPYVELALRHIDVDGKRFVIIQMSGFRESPVICTGGDGRHLRAAAVYTRSFTKHETIEVRDPAEMRELLDRAIEAGVEKRLRPFMQAFRETFGGLSPQDIDARRFEEQRGGL
ncbi:MAG: ATP-binding protein [Dehalococcoidia bacterium]